MGSTKRVMSIVLYFTSLFSLNVSLSPDDVLKYYIGKEYLGIVPPRQLMEDIIYVPCYTYDFTGLKFHYIGTVNVTADGKRCMDSCLTFDNQLGVGCDVKTDHTDSKMYCNVCKNNWRGYNACTLPNAGMSYDGNLSRTLTGRNCMNWDKAMILSKQMPHQYDAIIPSAFPDISIIGLTKCRNPTPYSRDGPWCYFASNLTADAFKWEYCDPCGSDPGLEILERDLKGERNNTLPLRMPNLHSCMAFCALHYECKKASFARRMCYIYVPKGHKYIFTAAVTFGYNNKTEPLTLTSDHDWHDALWISGTLPTEGITYSGTLNRTRDGSMCLPWSLFKERGNYLGSHFPDQSVSDALNYCRQTGKYIGEPYCHVDAYNVSRVKSCDVKASNYKAYKSCMLPRNGYLYRGSKSVTITGRKCISWLHAARLSKYLPHLYEDIPNKAFSGPKPSKKYAASFCRNPTPQTRYGPWCFVEYEEYGRQIHSWEYCDVCSKVKPVAELQIGYVKDIEVVKDVLYINYSSSSEYECHHICSVLAHCSAAMFILTDKECLIGWRNVAKDLISLSFKSIPDAHLIYIFRKPCILKDQQDDSLSIRQRCFTGESCYFSEKIEYISSIKEIGERLCAKHCLESTSCFQYLLIGEYCYIYKQDICGCFTDVSETMKDVTVVTRCYEYAKDEIYFENDEVLNIFNADDYLIYQKSALSWVPADDNGTDQEEIVSVLETIERKKEMGNFADEGISPAYIGKVLKVLMVVWTSLIAVITFVTCFLYIPYF